MKKNSKHSVMLVEDHPLTRKGLADAINAEPDLEVCWEAEGWREVLGLLERHRPDMIILDLNLKDGNGWELLKQLESNPVAPPVLVVSVCDEEVYAVRLLRSGARGYLMKDAPIGKVLEAIRKILNGNIAVSDSIASSMIQAAANNIAVGGQTKEIGILSDRELQVLEFLRQGLGNIDIAARLGISQKTVGTYKARLMEKLGVRTTPELIAQIRTIHNVDL